MATTLDGLLNHRVTIEQPSKGFRVAIDTLLLAAAVPARAGERILELGCGVGGAMLALACREPNVKVTGIEIQPGLAALCQSNIERNNRQAFLNVIVGNATHDGDVERGAFDHVMMNPPYHDEARHDASAHTSKRMATTENNGELSLWITTSAQALKPGGRLIMIHRADRQNEIIDHLKGSFGAVRLKSVVTKPDAPAKRILVQAVKGAHEAPFQCQPLIVHASDGSYTPEAESILRHMEPLPYI